jgi:hypothetical protein
MIFAEEDEGWDRFAMWLLSRQERQLVYSVGNYPPYQKSKFLLRDGVVVPCVVSSSHERRFRISSVPHKNCEDRWDCFE